MNTRKSTIKRACVVSVVVLAVCAFGAQAESNANYGDFEASRVWYNQVIEATDQGVYGTPVIAGDTLNFTPADMYASVPSQGSVTHHAELEFDIQAKDGNFISGIDFSEAGDFSINGPDAAYVDVTAYFTVSIYEVDGVAIDSFYQQFEMTILPEVNGKVALKYPGVPSADGDWGGAIYIDLLAMLDDQYYSYDQGVTLAHVNLDNILTAASNGADTDAYISKESLTGGLSISATVIPEPASGALFLGTASMFVFIRRRFIG